MEKKMKSVSCSVVSDSLRSHGLYPARFLCSWNSSGKNTGVGSHFLLQKNMKKNIYIYIYIHIYICVYVYICITESFCYTADIKYNNVNQLYFNKNFFKFFFFNGPNTLTDALPRRYIDAK